MSTATIGDVQILLDALEAIAINEDRSNLDGDPVDVTLEECNMMAEDALEDYEKSKTEVKDPQAVTLAELTEQNHSLKFRLQCMESEHAEHEKDYLAVWKLIKRPNESVVEACQRLVKELAEAKTDPQAVTLEANLFWPASDPEISGDLQELLDDANHGEIVELMRAVSLKNAFYARVDCGKIDEIEEIIGPFDSKDEAAKFLAERAKGAK